MQCESPATDNVLSTVDEAAPSLVIEREACAVEPVGGGLAIKTPATVTTTQWARPGWSSGQNAFGWTTQSPRSRSLKKLLFYSSDGARGEREMDQAHCAAEMSWRTGPQGNV